jgi:hypothetical protein
MSNITPINTRKEIAEITSLFRQCLLGEELSKIWECSPGNISQAERHGHGEIKKIVETILETKAAVQCKSCTPVMGKEAVDRLVNLINRIAGYHAFQPIRPTDDIRDQIEASRLVLRDTHMILGEISASLEPKSEEGEKTSHSERKRITEACRKAIGHLAAIIEMEDKPIS